MQRNISCIDKFEWEVNMSLGLRKAIIDAKTTSKKYPGTLFSVVIKTFCRPQVVVTSEWLRYWTDKKKFTNIVSFLDGKPVWVHIPSNFKAKDIEKFRKLLFD